MAHGQTKRVGNSRLLFLLLILPRHLTRHLVSNRQWTIIICNRLNNSRAMIGIDISATACRVMAKRLRDVCTRRKANALARWTRLHRPRPAVDGGEAARHPAV